MNARLKINMGDVIRLTRDGRLDEAMAILRGAIPSVPSTNLGGNMQPGSKGPTIEMVPPSWLTGESWTPPKWGDADLWQAGADQAARWRRQALAATRFRPGA